MTSAQKEITLTVLWCLALLGTVLLFAWGWRTQVQYNVIRDAVQACDHSVRQPECLDEARKFLVDLTSLD